jgi:hypothetical protein
VKIAIQDNCNAEVVIICEPVLPLPVQIKTLFAKSNVMAEKSCQRIFLERIERIRRHKIRSTRSKKSAASFFRPSRSNSPIGSSRGKGEKKEGFRYSLPV